jgi:archaemetzincin
MKKLAFFLVCVLGLAAMTFAAHAATEASKMKNLVIVTVGGQLSVSELEFLVQPLQEAFGVSVSFGSGLPLPAHAYNRERRQYLSNIILDMLNSRLSVSQGSRVLAVTNEDLYVPDLNFVFGQADASTGIAIISLARLRPEFFGKPPDEALFHQRAITEAVHEIGHTMGLIEHCPDRKCVMHFSNSLTDTDIKGHRFCIKCRRILGIESPK